MVQDQDKKSKLLQQEKEVEMVMPHSVSAVAE